VEKAGYAVPRIYQQAQIVSVVSQAGDVSVGTMTKGRVSGSAKPNTVVARTSV